MVRETERNEVIWAGSCRRGITVWVQCGFILIIGNRSACSQHSFDVYY
jgi:hypothetical protein